MKPLLVSIAILVAGVVGFFLGRGRAAQPAIASVVDEAPTPTRSQDDIAEIDRLRSQLAELGRQVEIQQNQIPMLQPFAVTSSRRPASIAFDQHGNFTPSSVESLGLTPEQADRGMPLIHAAMAELEKIQLDHMAEPVATGDTVVLRIGDHTEQTTQVIEKLLNNLSAVWNPSAVEALRRERPERALRFLAGGFGERLITIRPSDSRPGIYLVGETSISRNRRSSSNFPLDADQLRKRYGIAVPAVETP